jgi:hypothetical protein
MIPSRIMVFSINRNISYYFSFLNEIKLFKKFKDRIYDPDIMKKKDNIWIFLLDDLS